MEDALSSVVSRLPQIEIFCYCMSIWKGTLAALMYYITMGGISIFFIYVGLDYVHKAETIIKYFQMPFLYSAAVVGMVLCLLGLAIILHGPFPLPKIIPLLYVVCGFIHGTLYLVWWLLAFVRAFVAPGLADNRHYVNSTEIVTHNPLLEALFVACFLIATPFGFYTLISFNSHFNADVYADEEE